MSDGRHHEDSLVARTYAVLKGVTEEPWEVHESVDNLGDASVMWESPARGPLPIFLCPDCGCCGESSGPDAAFIASARTLVPELLTAVENFHAAAGDGDTPAEDTLAAVMAEALRSCGIDHPELVEVHTILAALATADGRTPNAAIAGRVELEVRALHTSILTTDPDGYGNYRRCSCGFSDWKSCATAKVVYSADELSK